MLCRSGARAMGKAAENISRRLSWWRRASKNPSLWRIIQGTDGRQFERQIRKALADFPIPAASAPLLLGILADIIYGPQRSPYNALVGPAPRGPRRQSPLELERARDAVVKENPEIRSAAAIARKIQDKGLFVFLETSSLERKLRKLKKGK